MTIRPGAEGIASDCHPLTATPAKIPADFGDALPSTGCVHAQRTFEKNEDMRRIL
jgi:hypothetical protein